MHRRKQISTFVFAAQIVQFLFFLNPSFKPSPVTVQGGLCWKPLLVFSCEGSNMSPVLQTLQRMRDYEKKLAEKEKKVNSQKSQTGETTMTQTDRCSSSAMDQGSEASATSDVPVSLVLSLIMFYY